MRAATAMAMTLQRRMQGRVVPDSFTTAPQQRVRWLMAGMQSGDPRLATFCAICNGRRRSRRLSRPLR
jgi:predicted metalloprotease